MQDALIGKTGFVGTTLLGQHGFAAAFNRTDIATARGRAFGTVVCAAAPGSMFEANRFADADDAAIDALIDELRQIRAARFVLISTIAVLARFDGGEDETTAAFQQDLPYGRNRRRLEVFCRAQFPRCLILRLPALFGPRLRKNFLFDIRNPIPSMLTEARLADSAAALPAGLRAAFTGLYHPDPRLELRVVDRAAAAILPEQSGIEAALEAAGCSAIQFTHPDSRFQYYGMGALWADITRAQTAGLDLLHLAPEPLTAGAIHARLTGRPMAAGTARIHREDMRTRHAALWGRSGCYSASAAEVLNDIAAFHLAEGA